MTRRDFWDWVYSVAVLLVDLALVAGLLFIVWLAVGVIW